MQIPVNTQVTWQGTFELSTWEFISGSGGNALISKLTQAGFGSVSMKDVTTGILPSFTREKTAVITVVTKSTVYASEDDVQALIENAIYQATGNLPSASDITDVTLPSTTSAGGTVAPGTSVTPGKAALPACDTGFFGWLAGKMGSCQPQAASASSGGILSGITSSGTMYIALVIFGFVAALALIGYSGALRRGSQ